MISLYDWILFGLLGAGTILAFVRLLKGGTPADRAVALDTMTLISTCMIVLIAFFEGRSMLLDVALVYSVLSFLGVLAIARFMDGGLR